MILADTGFFLALANRREAHHARATQAFAKVRGSLHTTWPVLTETCHLLASRLGMDAELKFVHSMTLGAVEIFSTERSHLSGSKS